jgi:hypothetical protein
MKTFRSETIQIERYLLADLTELERQEFRARMAQNPRLRLRLYFQKKVHLLLKLYHRKQVKAELEVLHQELFSDPMKAAWQNQIQQIFQ